MTFWEMAYGWGWATVEQMRTVTELGELTKEDFKRITGQDFDPTPVVPEEQPVVPEEPAPEPEPKKK